MRPAAVAALCLLAIAGTAAAQPGMSPPSALPPPTVQPPGEPVNETTALMLSLGGTAAAWGLFAISARGDRPSGSTSRLATIGVLGTLVAPSFGHWYAHELLSRGLGLRVGGVAASLVGLIAAAACSECEINEPAVVLVLTGAALYVVGTLDDIATAPRRARHYNERVQGLAVAPMVGRDSAGFAITGRF